MKTITIPKRFGYPTVDITINGKEQTFASGVEISVEDSVAEAIENAIALAPKPKRYLSLFDQRIEGSLERIEAKDLEGITAIGVCAFYCCLNLIEVTIPNCITFIGDSAFDWCKKLAKVYLPLIPPTLENANAFNTVKDGCTFYCKTQESLDAYKTAANWSTLTGTYTFVVEN